METMRTTTGPVIHEIVVRDTHVPRSFQVDCLGCGWYVITPWGLEHAMARAENHLHVAERIEVARQAGTLSKTCGPCGHGQSKHLGGVCLHCECEEFKAWAPLPGYR